MLEIPHERRRIKEFDGGYADGMEGNAQSSSVEDAEGGTRMLRAIIGFHKDEEDHWVADLKCGHGQHVRHDPPWQIREWVRTEAGRTSRLGMELNCKRCDEEGAAET